MKSTNLLLFDFLLYLTMFLASLQANLQSNYYERIWKSLENLNGLLLSTPHIEEVCGPVSFTVGLPKTPLSEEQTVPFVQSHHAPSELNINILDEICKITVGLPASVGPITNGGHRLLMNAEQTCHGPGAKEDVTISDIDVLLLVSSKPERRKKRDVIRRYWANTTCWLGANMRHVFLLGATDNARVSATDLHDEQLVNRDIVQQDTEYLSDIVTSQLLFGFKWAIAFCPQAKWLLFVEDTYFVNPFNVISLLSSISHAMSHRLVIGHVWHRLSSKTLGSTHNSYKPEGSSANISERYYYIPVVATSAMLVSGSLVPSLYLTMRFTHTKEHPDFFFAYVMQKLFLQPAHSRNIFSHKRFPATTERKLHALIFPMEPLNTDVVLINNWSLWKQQPWCLL